MMFMKSIMFIMFCGSFALPRDPSAGAPDCTPEDDHLYPDPYDCSMYWQCTPQGPELESCPDGLEFSEEFQVCDFPENVGCSSSSPPTTPATTTTEVPTTTTEGPATTTEVPTTTTTKDPTTTTTEDPTTTTEVPTTTEIPTTTNPPIDLCPSDWKYGLGNCYFIGPEEELVYWESAQGICMGKESHVLEIRSSEEQDFITDILKDEYMIDLMFWLGAQDFEEEGQWLWSNDGSPLEYTNWGKKQPDNQHGVEDCMALHPHYEWFKVTNVWKDDDCKITHNYICKRVLL